MKRLPFILALLLCASAAGAQSFMIPYHPAQEMIAGKIGFQAIVATLVDSTFFTANWKVFPGGSGYKLDVSTSSSFASYFIQDSTVTGTSKAVTGLAQKTVYYYRLRVTKGTKVYQSNTITVTTLETPFKTLLVQTSGASLVGTFSNGFVVK